MQNQESSPDDTMPYSPPTNGQLAGEIFTIQRRQRSLKAQIGTMMARMCTANRRSADDAKYLYQHIRRIEWILCAALALICLLMITLGMMWRALI